MSLRPRHTATDNVEQQIQLVGTIGMAIAAATTVIRLTIRARKLGWDDALAFVGLLCLITTGVTGKLHYSLKDGSDIPHHPRIAMYYILAVGFDLTIWLSRTSVLFSIIRFGRYQRQLYFAASLFFIAVIILVAQVFWVCEPQDRRTHWKSKVVPQCVLGKSVAIVQVTTDALADTVLITVPLIILPYLRSPHSTILRIRLSASFAIGGLTTIVSTIHAYYLWQDTEISIVVGNAELAVSVIICNFVVLAAATHQLWVKLCPQPKGVGIAQKSTINMMFASQNSNSQSEMTIFDTQRSRTKSKTFTGLGIQSTETA